MVNFKQQMEADGISEKAEKLITNARRQGTQARYEAAWISGLAGVHRGKLILFDAL